MNCKFCGKETNNNFCSKTCLAKYAISFKKNFNLKEIYDKMPLIKRKCLICGKDVLVKPNVSKVKCFECRHKPCKICGNRNGHIDETICRHRLIFKTLISKFGFDQSTLGSIKAYEEYNRIRNELFCKYWTDKRSLLDLMKDYGYSNVQNFSKIFNTLEIPRRNLSDAQIVAFETNRRNISTISFNMYKCGYHISWDKKKCFLRSSYEFDYAKELDEQHIRYETERFGIKYYDRSENRYRIAIPDFYLPDSNTLVEIKSTYFYDEKNMKDKFTEYRKLGYNAKLILEHKEVVL